MQRILVGMTIGLLVVTAPSAAHAQRGGSRGGGGGHASGGHVAPASGARVAPAVGRSSSFSPGNSRYYYNPGYYARPYGYGRFYGGVGIYLGGSYAYPYGYGVDYPDIYYPPAYGPADAGPSYIRPSDPLPPDAPPAPERARLANIANIRVILPTPDAKLLVDGNPTTSTGSTRVLETPELQPGATYHYDFTVTWEEGARTITEKRRIDVTPGAVTTVDFTRPAPLPKP